MTRKEAEKIKGEIKERNGGALYGKKLNEADERTLREIECRDMATSCICYNSTSKDSAKESFFGKTYRWGYPSGYGMHAYADRYIDELGIETVERLFEEQYTDICIKGEIKRNTFTDSEGLTYNSIVYADEK